MIEQLPSACAVSSDAAHGPAGPRPPRNGCGPRRRSSRSSRRGRGPCAAAQVDLFVHVLADVADPEVARRRGRRRTATGCAARRPRSRVGRRRSRTGCREGSCRRAPAEGGDRCAGSCRAACRVTARCPGRVARRLRRRRRRRRRAPCRACRRGRTRAGRRCGSAAAAGCGRATVPCVSLRSALAVW